MVKIEIDTDSGFCFGVVTAIKKAEEALLQHGTIYCLGDIVHNSKEVERLEKKGLITIDHQQYASLQHKKVMLRAHGEPPEVYEKANANNIILLDATCPVVLRLQKKIRTAYLESNKKEDQIVIFGKKGHAEVNGLVGQTEGNALVIESVNDVNKIDFNKNIVLFSQTTKSIDEFKEIIKRIKQLKSEESTFHYFDTICRQVANRIPNIKRFALSYEVILFVSGKKSSNGKILLEECRKVNPNTRLVSYPDEISKTWLEGVKSVGICGATSTPAWLMEEVADKVHELVNKRDT